MHVNIRKTDRIVVPMNLGYDHHTEFRNYSFSDARNSGPVPLQSAVVPAMEINLSEVVAAHNSAAYSSTSSGGVGRPAPNSAEQLDGSHRTFVHKVHQRPRVVDGRLRQDTVAKIEDVPWPTSRLLQNVSRAAT